MVSLVDAAQVSVPDFPSNIEMSPDMVKNLLQSARAQVCRGTNFVFFIDLRC
jgi:hypothetical protein